MAPGLIRTFRIINILFFTVPALPDKRLKAGMQFEEKQRLARTGDMGDQAIKIRLIAARRAAGLSQKDMAHAAGITQTTYNSQEVKGRPSLKAVRFLYQNHRIDFNFVYHGDFAQLPGDVQAALFSALAALEQ